MLGGGYKVIKKERILAVVKFKRGVQRNPAFEPLLVILQRGVDDEKDNVNDWIINSNRVDGELCR